MTTRRSEDDLVEALDVRLDETTTEARRFVTRCAWCSRYHVGGRWIAVTDRSPQNVTHGICHECFESLRVAGLSR